MGQEIGERAAADVEDSAVPRPLRYQLIRLPRPHPRQQRLQQAIAPRRSKITPSTPLSLCAFALNSCLPLCVIFLDTIADNVTMMGS